MGSVIACYLVTACYSVLFTLRVQVVEHQVPFGGQLDEEQCEDLNKKLINHHVPSL